MWEKTYSKKYENVSKDAIWKIWTDVNNWSSWHHDIDYCKMDGPFVVGNHFMLKPKKVSPVKITLTDVQKGKGFTDCTTFFGAKMFDTHSMQETKNGLIITNKVVVTGPLRWLWVKLVAQNVASTVPKHMDDLMNLVRSKGA